MGMVLPRNTQTNLDRSSGISLTARGGETFNQVYESSTHPALPLQPNLENENRFSRDKYIAERRDAAGDSLLFHLALEFVCLNGGYVRLTNVTAGPSVAVLVLKPEICLALVPLITS